MLALADSLGVERFAYAGVSLGGAVGLHLAVHHPRAGVVAGRPLFVGALQRCEGVGGAGGDGAREGLAKLADGADGRWFTPGFTVPRLVQDHPGRRPGAYAACCDALAASDLRDRLGEISRADAADRGPPGPGATRPRICGRIADAVPGRDADRAAGASHLAPAERPEAVLTALRAHFDGGARRGHGGTARGAGGRPTWTGAQGRQSPFTARFQDFISRYAWGEIWTDETLSRRERSIDHA